VTGPEHYREAERIVRRVADASTSTVAVRWAAEAQVHATLALAAATALNDADEGMALDDHHAWRMAASAEFDTTLPGVML
jgi:hypothetical protein